MNLPKNFTDSCKVWEEMPLLIMDISTKLEKRTTFSSVSQIPFDTYNLQESFKSAPSRKLGMEPTRIELFIYFL